MTRTSSERSDSNDNPLGLAENDRHRLLSSERRRVLLEVLAERTAPDELTDLAVAVAERENPVVDEETVDDVAILLHHVHLPILAEYALVDYDPASRRVESLPVPPGGLL